MTIMFLFILSIHKKNASFHWLISATVLAESTVKISQLLTANRNRQRESEMERVDAAENKSTIRKSKCNNKHLCRERESERERGNHQRAAVLLIIMIICDVVGCCFPHIKRPSLSFSPTQAAAGSVACYCF